MEGDRERRTSSGNTLRLVGAGADQQTSSQADDGPGPAPDADNVTVIPGVAQASIVLPGQRQSVAVGRHWVVSTAAENDVTGMANQVLELLSSEVLANAVLHGPEGAAVGLQLRVTDQAVRVSVSDGGARSPVVLHREPTAPSGRGMAIVEAMSSRWGVEEHSEGGKTVWFELDFEEF